MREVQVYSIIRECHLHITDDNVREHCDRLVQVLMRDEEGEEDAGAEAMTKAKDRTTSETQAINEDENVMEIF